MFQLFESLQAIWAIEHSFCSKWLLVNDWTRWWHWNLTQMSNLCSRPPGRAGRNCQVCTGSAQSSFLFFPCTGNHFQNTFVCLTPSQDLLPGEPKEWPRMSCKQSGMQLRKECDEFNHWRSHCGKQSHKGSGAGFIFEEWVRVKWVEKK